jgi:hypothetical protein
VTGLIEDARHLLLWAIAAGTVLLPFVLLLPALCGLNPRHYHRNR